jgi:protein SCO1/2
MSDRSSILRFVALSLVLSGAVAYTGLKVFGTPRSSSAGGPTFSDFQVQSGDDSIRLADFQGKVVAVYFGYASCPDICPTTLSTMSSAFKQLPPDQLDRTRGLFVSVDPERDTPAHAKSYAAFFHPNIVGATSTPADVAAIAQDWGVRYEKAEGASEAMGYTVDHTSIVFLVGPDGSMKKALPHGSNPAALSEAIAALLEAAP